MTGFNTVLKTFDNGTQLESDGVVRVPCGFTPSTSTCGDQSCIKNRAREADNIIKREIANVNDIASVKNTIEGYDKQIKQAAAEIKKQQTLIDICTNYKKDYQTKLESLEVAEKERKAKQQKLREEKEAKARATIAEQIASLSPERLADLLVEQGLTQIGPKPDSARVILTEAYDTLAASFWIKSDETRSLSSYYDSPLDLPTDVKAIAVKAGDGKYKAVTGMCAVGALAMARAMMDDEPVQEWGNLVAVDRSARIAAEALAWAILQEERYTGEIDPTTKVTSVITYWNDQPERDKDEVLATWNKAITECSFLDMGEDSTLYRLRTEFTPLNYPFTSAEEAAASLQRLKDNKPETPWEKRVRFVYAENAVFNGLYVTEYKLPQPLVAKV